MVQVMAWREWVISHYLEWCCMMTSSKETFFALLVTGVSPSQRPVTRIHYDDVTMSLMASQINSLTIVYSAVNSGADQRKHQSSASLLFMRGIPREPVNSPHNLPVTRKMFPFDDVIMLWYFQTNSWANNHRWFETPSGSLWRHCKWSTTLTHLSSAGFNDLKFMGRCFSMGRIKASIPR